jgi:outer membrane lipoprotein SlyB
MNKTFITTILLSTILFPLSTESVQAATVMAVSYGTITGVNQQARDTSGGATGGALLGGIVGLASGSGRSRSNRALRTLGGAAVGSAAGRTMAQGTEMVYTVDLVSGGTVRVVMDSGNFARGDCVAVEQGGPSANLRRVSSEFCFNNAAVPQQYKASIQREADQCAEAKQRLLAAETEEQVNTAAMVMNILCQD